MLGTKLSEKILAGHQVADFGHRHTFQERLRPERLERLRHTTLHARKFVVSRGLLDSYRQDQGIAIEQSRKQPPKRVRHPRSVDHKQSDDEDSLCTPDCVRDVYTAKEFREILDQENPNTLVVVDFYKTACGSCRYIQPGFVKLCHNSEEEHAPVVFLKHNVIDEADQDTDLSEELKIQNVPLFQFYKENELLEQFATRDKGRIGNAINRHVGWEVCHT